jgi:hypothetical protein
MNGTGLQSLPFSVNRVLKISIERGDTRSPVPMAYHPMYCTEWKEWRFSGQTVRVICSFGGHQFGLLSLGYYILLGVSC